VENERCRRMIDPVKESQIQEKADASYKVMMESKEILSGIREALEESKGMMQRHYEDQLVRGLLHDLASAVGEYEGYKNLGNPKRVEGTCEWFFGDADFRKWREAEAGVLWVTAGPGCGKSVLARALVDEGRLTTRVTTTSVAHFFFKKGDGRRVSAANALAGLVHQLFTQNGRRRELMDEALRRHRSYGPALASNFNELWQILAHYVASPDAGEVVCVLDALDECDERDREMLLERIREFYQRRRTNNQRGKLKFVITSRPHDGIEVAIGKLSRVGALEHVDGDGLSREIGDEINLVIDDKLSTITASFSAQDRERISNKLKGMEHRTYLWLHLTLDIIEKAPSRFCRVRDLESFLAKLPSEVSEAYEQVLSHTTDRHQAETLLNIVVAAQRPLTLDEANIALTLALDDPMPTAIDELNPWPKDRFKGVVQRLCGTFVTVSDGKLSLIHQTARDFLLSPDRSVSGWRGSLSLPGAHDVMSRTCLHYLGLLANHTLERSHMYLDPKEYRSLQQEHAFLSYAAAHWPTHHRDAEITPPPTMNAKSPKYDALVLCNTANSHVWAPQHFSRGSFLRWWTWTDLALASYIGLASTVEALVSPAPPDDKANGLNAKSSDFGTPLQTAAAGGHERVVCVLLEQGAEVNRDDAGIGGHGTALRIAAARGHAGIVALLLQAGADANMGVRGRGQGTALEAAKAGGHRDVVQILNKVSAVSSMVADDDEEVDTPLLPTWFGHDDFEVEPPRIEMPHWNSAHMPAWVHGDDDGVDVRPPENAWPVIVPPAKPLQRAMALQYMVDDGDEIELLDFENEKRMTGGVALSVPWLRA
jgi:ankyrin repeat domain-containing protein 50